MSTIEEDLFELAFAWERQDDGTMSYTFDQARLSAYVRAKLRELGNDFKSVSFSAQPLTERFLASAVHSATMGDFCGDQIDAAVERACGKEGK